MIITQIRNIMLVYCDEHFFVGKNSRMHKSLPKIFYDIANNITKSIKRNKKKRYTKEDLYGQLIAFNKTNIK